MRVPISSLPKTNQLNASDEILILDTTDSVDPNKVATLETLGNVVAEIANTNVDYYVQEITQRVNDLSNTANTSANTSITYSNLSRNYSNVAQNAANNAVAVTTGGTASLTPAAGKIPLADAQGVIDLNWLGDTYASTIRMAAIRVNDIGKPGDAGFGVGIARPEKAEEHGASLLPGTLVLGSPEYGNYIFADGSIACYVPCFYYKWTLNTVDVLSMSAFPDVASANAAGWAVPTGFYNGGTLREGVWVDKYLCSNNGGIASSIFLGNPVAASPTANVPFNTLNGTPSNTLGGAIAAAKTRGGLWHCMFHNVRWALAVLSFAHGQNARSTLNCAWYDPNRITNFPKGNNNNALGDINDNTLTFISDGFTSNSAKTGSANILAKTAHNGQNCGVVDLSGNFWEVSPGLTCDGTNYYSIKSSVAKETLTNSTTLSDGLWGTTGISTNYDVVGTEYGPLLGLNRNLRVGFSPQTFSSDTSGVNYIMSNLGIPLDANTSGLNSFGIDFIYDFRPANMCPSAGGTWTTTSGSGVWALALSITLLQTSTAYGFRSALYP